jgi:PAS domain S-box-containing protein
VYRWFQLRSRPVRDSEGHIIRWYSLLTDIDDRKRAEEALRLREQRFRLIFDSIPGLVSTRAATGAPEFVNKQMLEFFGQSLEQLPDWSSLIHPDDRERVMSVWCRSVATGQPYDVEHRARRIDGVYRWVYARGEALRDSEGRIVRWWNLITDIDDRKRAEDALSKARADLAHVTRTTAMGELAASIAHEVNQPLTAVVTNANACLRWLNRIAPNLDEARDAVQRIIRDGNRGSEVIGRVRAMLKKEEPLKTRVNINEIVQEIARLVQIELRGTVLQMELANELPRVYADGVQLQQVLLNLMMNAHDAMKTVSNRPHVLRIETKSYENDTVLVAVQDSGVGLQPEKIEQLFEPFYTTKPEGLGMGLSISRSIIEGYGGRLWAECNAGPGALFQFTLPVQNEGTA